MGTWLALAPWDYANQAEVSPDMTDYIVNFYKTVGDCIRH